MSKIIIKGPARLKGTVSVSGAKNAALPAIAATLLVKDGEVTIKNVPEINDVKTMLKILENMGSRVSFKNNVLRIDNSNLKKTNPDKTLVKKIRASILLVAPLLARNNKIEVSTPGGCFIGNRPLDTHFAALKQLGTKIVEKDQGYLLKADKIKANDITLAEMSVTATENILMAAASAKGETKIKMAASEPHVQDLCRLLVKMGVKISGIGTHTLKIKGTKDFKPCTHTLIGDEIEAGTYIAAAAATSSEITVKNIDPNKMMPSVFEKFKEANVKFEFQKNGIKVKKSPHLKPVKIWVAPAPHFPSDLQAPFAVLATQAVGTTLIHETMYEGRLNYLKELNKMGANASILDPHRAVVIGPTRLIGKKINSLDLRAGATLIIASLIAEGETEIDGAEIIDRGYEDIVKKFKNLGVRIERV